MKVGIVGKGHVGTAMNNIFKDAIIYDEPKKIGSREKISACEVVFICVPTPENADGSCNTEIVDNILCWLQSDVIVLRSTVPVGYTDQQKNKLKKNIVFHPEYYGETIAHPFAGLESRKWLTFGGDPKAVNKVIQAYQEIYNSDVQLMIVDAKTAELAKYMENCYLALKVTFCNEFYDLAGAFDVDYNLLRETWLMDPRIGKSHTFVYPNNRGFGGSCLPKDLAATLHQANQLNADTTLLKAIKLKNNIYQKYSFKGEEKHDKG